MTTRPSTRFGSRADTFAEPLPPLRLTLVFVTGFSLQRNRAPGPAKTFRRCLQGSPKTEMERRFHQEIARLSSLPRRAEETTANLIRVLTCSNALRSWPRGMGPGEGPAAFETPSRAFPGKNSQGEALQKECNDIHSELVRPSKNKCRAEPCIENLTIVPK